MPIIAWNATFSIGEETIDEQHRLLMEMINKLQLALSHGQGPDETGAILKDLVSYIEHHFSHEEELMSRVGFPGLTRHQSLHRGLTRDLGEMLKRLKRGEDLSAFQLLSFLKHWWQDHILQEDKKIGRYIQFCPATRAAAPKK